MVRQKAMTTAWVVIAFYVVCTGLEPVFRNLNRRDCPLDRSLVSVEKAADEISATGGPRRLSPVDVSHLRSPGSMSGAGHNKKSGPPLR